MRINRNLVGLAAVAALAYAAGHFGAFSGHDAVAVTQPEAEIPAEMQAYMALGEPGEHHRHLDAMIGEWSGEFTMHMPGMPPMTSRGTVSREWVLGGRYIHETIEATSEMGTFTGIGYIGYNNLDGQYEIIWMDSMSTAIYTETATFNPDTKVLSTRGTHRDPKGQVINVRGKLDLSNPDRHVFVSYLITPDGKEFKHFEGFTSRK